MWLSCFSNGSPASSPPPASLLCLTSLLPVTVSSPCTVSSLKQGKVVIVLAGRYAGKKAIVVAAKAATKKRPYAHALIAGLIRSPRAVSKTMSKTTIMRKSSIKVFVKNINAAHIMPTRYSATDIKLNDIVVPQKVENAGAGRDKIVARVRRAFSAKYIARGAKHSTGVQYFFQKLRF